MVIAYNYLLHAIKEDTKQCKTRLYPYICFTKKGYNHYKIIIMSDITKCKGVNCPIKDQCKRYTAKESILQSYFMESPIKDGKCDMYWGEHSESIFNQLKEIMKL